MGRVLSEGLATSNESAGGAQGYNPSGIFGGGKNAFFAVSGNFTVPLGVTSLRVRCFGAAAGGTGAGQSGGGGGFALKTITGLVPGTSIAVTIGVGGLGAVSGGTTSFGPYVSATGGIPGGAGGVGVGGDINNAGGTGNVNGGAGAGNYFGPGANATGTNSIAGIDGTSGSGGGGTANAGGNGLSGTGAFVASGVNIAATDFFPGWGIDYFGTGGGGSTALPGKNGGGGGYGASNGGFPGGGGGAGGTTRGGNGLVIVEW